MQEDSSLWSDSGPDTLRNICAKFCIKNLETFCTCNPINFKYSIKKSVVLPVEICECLISKIIEDNILDDSYLEIFSNTETTRLRQLHLQNSFVTDDGLRKVLQHRIVDLNISNCLHLTETSMKHINSNSDELLNLHIGTSTQVIPRIPTIPKSAGASLQPVLHAPKLQRLTIHGLRVSGIGREFYEHMLHGLNNLTHLDLSSCSPLKKLTFLSQVPNLLSLVLHGVHRLPDAIGSICKLRNLRHLDLSQSNDENGIYQNPNQVLEAIVTSLENLTSLDISGTNLAGRGAAEHQENEAGKKNLESQGDEYPLTDIPGLRSRVNRPLNFLGLFNTLHEACLRHHIPAKHIAGDANEEQILVAAQVYSDRPQYLQKILNDLFHIFRFDTCHSTRIALQVILNAMNKHKKDKHVQISGSASLFYIVRGEEKKCFTVNIKRKIVKTTLDAMWEHREENTMLRNGCLTLCQFKIPQDVFFVYERLVRILLTIVGDESNDDFVQRIGIYLLNSLACQVDGVLKRLIGNMGAITTMLALIDRRLRDQVCDDVMEIAWSTLWNVTDETALNCERFLDGGGMQLFLSCLKAFPDRAELLRNMMGLLGNVAEVKELRSRLMTRDYLEVFSDLLDSTSDGIEVSYNAAGVLSHLASDGYDNWNIAQPSREEVLLRMKKTIERWDLKTKRNIHYRSFEPIIRLLKIDHTPEARHWAIWALANLTGVYPERYCPLVLIEDALPLLKELVNYDISYPKIRELATTVVQNCQQFQQLGRLEDSEDNSDKEML